LIATIGPSLQTIDDSVRVSDILDDTKLSDFDFLPVTQKGRIKRLLRFRDLKRSRARHNDELLRRSAWSQADVLSERTLMSAADPLLSFIVDADSQRGEGWILVGDRYDDGGYSGGSLERPALRRLLDDVQVGKVDCVVVYKIDRLTRSLMDFSRLVDLFDKRSVTFVSVTQSFNTTTSMGRLTLNILLSFAQFERELGSERVRDKIAASKRRGIWTGGVVPLGYKAENRQLVIRPAEAEIVRRIFKSYVTLRSITKVLRELDAAGLRQRSGRPFDKIVLHKVLKNRTYRGMTVHKAEAYPAIIDEALLERGPVHQPGTSQDEGARGSCERCRSSSRADIRAGRTGDDAPARPQPWPPLPLLRLHGHH
jgi:DNA invertase Pin-like site-specific DNA recombinase